jgi:hypothetical protein
VSFFGPLLDPALRAVGKHSSAKELFKYFAKKITQMKLDSISPQNFWHYDGRKMDFLEIANTLNFSKQSK